jgi:hypothetical protein
MSQTHPHFDGETYEPTLDHSRLARQLTAVRLAMSDGLPHTLAELSRITGAPSASVSARIRDLRKPKFGGHVVHRERSCDDGDGVWLYRLQVGP